MNNQKYVILPIDEFEELKAIYEEGEYIDPDKYAQLQDENKDLKKENEDLKEELEAQGNKNHRLYEKYMELQAKHADLRIKIKEYIDNERNNK